MAENRPLDGPIPHYRIDSELRQDDGTWIETKDSAGGQSHFAEWKRNADYVLLFDRRRRMFLRCYDDHIDIFDARKGWGLLYKGSWAKS